MFGKEQTVLQRRGGVKEHGTFEHRRLVCLVYVLYHRDKPEALVGGECQEFCSQPGPTGDENHGRVSCRASDSSQGLLR